MHSTLVSTFLLFISLLSLISAKYADLVSPTEQPLATEIDSFAVEHHAEVYHFIAKTYEDNIIIQIRYENDTVAIEGYFTETPALLEDLEGVQKNIYAATVQAGLDGYSEQSLETLQSYRYGTPPEGENHEEKRVLCRPCRECLRDLNNHLEKKTSRCGQFCSVGANCITPGCQRCYYTGGECRWQKSCQIW
ncbi:hypothetical protein I302_105847 [Kwoniella bestiolae CBS 10118]|uniref:Uncharacterized protein n=1 Tax=Kwoniella bestiolae CBS 10118 TaxID=1296100 RepID=A0A1B9G2C3_9TREE|nr:hypothetical protein I302_04971 [Kwoniella bestiolae CBS 10118]OCF25161.1 hypothetical protein I302_04971 [Kwoniella bestiolae CBS 10118]